jgi:hypothetical protein
MQERLTYRDMAEGVPNLTNEMPYKCRLLARLIWRRVRGWWAPSNCRNVGFRGVGEGVAERTMSKSEGY